MKRKFALRVAVAALILQLIHVAASVPLSAAFKSVSVGEAPPPFTLTDLEGREWESSRLFDGGVTVVVFWATWSPRSKEILEDLEKLSSELGDDRLQVVAINAEHVEITADDRQAIKGMARELKLTARILLDRGLTVYSRYGTMALPSSLVVGEKGRVVFELAGYPTTMRSDLADGVKKALGMKTSAELRPPEEYKPKNNALMFYNFGRRLMEKGQDEKGEAQLLSAVEKDPDFVKPRVLLGIHFKKTGRLEEALEQFRAIKALDPSNVEAGYQEASVSLRAGRLAEAEELFRELNEEFPEREAFALGMALTSKYQDRLADYQKAMSLARSLLPAEPRVHYELGAVAEAQGDLEVAAMLYHRALEGIYRK